MTTVAKVEADSVQRLRKVVRRAEREALDKARKNLKGAIDDVGTGQTIIRLQSSPVARLMDRGKIAGEELRAAEEITSVFMAITGALMLRAPSMEFRDRTSGTPTEPARMVDAHARYKAYAAYWSARARRGDRTLEIVIATVIDERSFRIIEQDLNIRNGKAEQATIWGLRDYAARADWCDKRLRTTWITTASEVFRLRRIDNRGQIRASYL